jgi:hypothetical protein
LRSGPVKPIYLMTMRIVRFRRKIDAAIAILSAERRLAAGRANAAAQFLRRQRRR